MLCQDCQKREATINLTQIVNNEKIAISLCKECGAARGFHSPLDNVPFPLADILAGLAKSSLPKKREEDLSKYTCKSCGQTFDEFTRQGRFGCGDCYTSFRPRLEPIMRKIHGASIHRGRSPEISDEINGKALVPVKEEERVADELRKAIDSEDFERAAELRDKLKTIRDKVAAEAE